MEWTARMTKEPRSGNRGKNFTVKYWRNQATQRRLGHVFPELARQANDAAKEYYDATRRQKKVHWDDFLTGGTNIWQPARYLDPDGSLAFDQRPPLTRRDGSSARDKIKQAEELLSAFFSPCQRQ